MRTNIFLSLRQKSYMQKCRSQCLSRLRSIIEVAAVQPYRTPYGTHLPVRSE
jgi:hypothetical protein